MLASSELAIATMDFRGRPVVPVVPYSTGPYARPLEQALLEALRSGDPAEVSKLVEQGADPNARVDGKLGSLLHVACDIPDVDAALVTASLLLDHSADAETRRNDGATCLFMACARGHTQLSELLLSRGPAMAHMLREDGSSSVFAAARAGHADCCQLLLAGGASANLPRHDGATPLLIATISSQPQARHAHTVHVQCACSVPTVRMQYVCIARQPRELKKLCGGLGARPTSPPACPHPAQVVKLLCGVRADPTPTYGGQNALGWANERGDDASAQLLIELHMVAEEEQRASFLALRALQALRI